MIETRRRRNFSFVNFRRLRYGTLSRRRLSPRILKNQLERFTDRTDIPVIALHSACSFPKGLLIDLDATIWTRFCDFDPATIFTIYPAMFVIRNKVLGP